MIQRIINQKKKMMGRLTQIHRIEEYGSFLAELMQGLKFPDNVKLVLELTEFEYNDLVPEQVRSQNIKDIELNTRAGINFFLKIKK